MQERLREGVLPKANADGLYDLRAVVLAYIGHVAKGAVGDDTVLGIKKRYWAARAEREQQRARAEAGQLLQRDEVEQKFAEVMTALAGTMDGLPGRLCAEFAGETNAATIRMRLLEELRRVRLETARQLGVGAGVQQIARSKRAGPAREPRPAVMTPKM